jgi:pimeloyl-ACP methyl ester carboxylesterase
VALGAAALGWFATPASARDELVEIASEGPGPPAYDHVLVHQKGPREAGRVLVLMPGTMGGAGDFTLLADELTKRVDDLQVWAVDRRSQALEDTRAFRRALAGKLTLQETFDHYLGWLTNGGSPPDHYRFLDTSTVPFAREWGMKTALEDAREVVRAAARGGREVILGGHSLGASLTAAYAAWDFHGRPGFRDVDALVLIDGGLLGSFDAYDLAQAQEQIAGLQTGNPFQDLFGNGVAESAGLFAEIGGIYARLEPTASAASLQAFPFLPDAYKPPVTVTNRALFGYDFDRQTSPSAPDLHANLGRLADTGDPRDWVDGGVTPVARLARTFGQEPSNSVEWFFPRRLTIDTNGADAMKMNDVAKFLGLRLEHTRQIDVPIYAFETDLTGGDVLRGARRLIRRARTTRRQSLLVEGAPEQSHLDPLTAAPGRNEFAKTLIRFLGRI